MVVVLRRVQYGENRPLQVVPSEPLRVPQFAMRLQIRGNMVMLSAEDSMWWKSGLETAVARHSVQGLAGCLATARLDVLSACTATLQMI